MPNTEKRSNLLGMLIALTLLFIFAQVSLLLAHILTHNVFDTFVTSSITAQVVKSKLVIFAFIHFLLSQTIIYIMYVALIYYVAISLGQLFRLNAGAVYFLGVFCWFFGVATILGANLLFVSHSFFAEYIQQHLLKNPISFASLEQMMKIVASIMAAIVIAILTNMILSVYHKRNVAMHLSVLLFSMVVLGYLVIQPAYQSALPVATAERPNIIIIGLDAARPDFINRNTPFLQKFLNSSISFDNAYTPLARTFPSWTSILTGRYPLHTHARGNNTKLSEIELTETLAKRLKDEGYETIYGTDDVRFNNINESFGFEKIVGPPMGINDFLIGSLNDFPISNLLVTTKLGKILFPYNYANHGAAATFSSHNFLQLLNQSLSKRKEKPLFIAVHFTVTGWPFYWFNDRQASSVDDVSRYHYGMQEGDRLVESFLKILDRQHLLEHSIVLLLSDHGVTLGLHNDRLLDKKNYLGDDAALKKISRYQYANTPKLSLNFKKDFGLDTSYGYGTDLLSLKQNHSFLAIKGYGVLLGDNHHVNARVSLLDITPTLLDVLNLSPLSVSDGISLKSYLSEIPAKKIPVRPFFFETSLTVPGIEQSGVSVEKVLNQTLHLYQMDAADGMVYFQPSAEKALDKDKQRGIILGDWMLVYLPAQPRQRVVWKQKWIFENFTIAPYFLLINLKTGKWTTQMKSQFASHSPVSSLRLQLETFYSHEIAHEDV